MFNEIRRLFRQSIEAFRQELGTREPEDEVSELLSAMRRELVAARAALPGFEEAIASVQVELTREAEALAQCERRARMAERIGDEETVRVANEFADRHRERIAVLEGKRSAAEAELDLRRREATEMAARYREAEANRFALLAQLRRARAGEGMRSAASAEAGPFADFERMSERVERDASIVDAVEELDGGRQPGDHASRERSVDEKLRDLKRRMGRGQ